ncbi:MAG: hypothetical protein WAX04_04820 [Oscillospiraceae bacterium]
MATFTEVTEFAKELVEYLIQPANSKLNARLEAPLSIIIVNRSYTIKRKELDYLETGKGEHDDEDTEDDEKLFELMENIEDVQQNRQDEVDE